MTNVAHSVLTEGERSFVNKVADYYLQNDGMEHDRGRVIGWLMICDPPVQTASGLVATLEIPRETVDRIVQQITPLDDDRSVFARIGDLTDPDYQVWMRENRWAPKIEKIFADLPALHGIIVQGLDALDGASVARRRRLANMERFIGFLNTEVPKIMERHAERVAGEQANK